MTEANENQSQREALTRTAQPFAAANGYASAWNVIGLPMLPLYIAGWMLAGAFHGVRVWCWNVLHAKPGDWRFDLPKRHTAKLTHGGDNEQNSR